MSRCFPFPPPGYEKKPQSNSLDLLLKKKKEKEHKQEKKEKEKKEGRERKDKERSKEKNREKKDKKEKRRDKDKKKDKDKREKRNEDKLRERKLEAVGSSNGAKNVDYTPATIELKKVDAAVTWQGTKTDLSGQSVAPKISAAVISSVADFTDQRRVDFLNPEDRRAGMSATTELRRVDVTRHESRTDMLGQPASQKKMSAAAISSVADFTDQRRVDFLNPDDGRADVAARNELKRVDPSATRQGTKMDTLGQPGAPKKISAAVISVVADFSDQRTGDFLSPDDRRADVASTIALKRVDQNAMWHETKTDLSGQPTGPKKISAVVSSVSDFIEQRVDFLKPEDRRANAASAIALKRVDQSTTWHETKTDLPGQPPTQRKVEGMDRSASVNASEKDRERKHKSKERSKDKEKKREKAREEGEKKSPHGNGPLTKRDRNGFSHEDETHAHKLLRLEPSSQLPVVNGVKPDSCHTGISGTADLKKSKVNGVVSVAAHNLPHPREVQLSRLLQLPKLEVQMEPFDQDWLLQKPVDRGKPGPSANGLHEVWAEAVLTGPEGTVILPYVVPF